MKPLLVMLAGPNGAGKSTFYESYLSTLGLPFLNADVPFEKIIARYARTLDNLERAIAQLPRVTVYDNSSFDEPYRFIAEFRRGKLHSRGGTRPPRWAQRFFKGL